MPYPKMYCTLIDSVPSCTVPQDVSTALVYLVLHYCTVLVCVCVCVMSFHLLWTSGLFVDVPAGVTQEEGRTGFLHLPSAVLALIFVARRIQLLLSLVDREVELCVLTN